MLASSCGEIGEPDSILLRESTIARQRADAEEKIPETIAIVRRPIFSMRKEDASTVTTLTPEITTVAE